MNKGNLIPPKRVNKAHLDIKKNLEIKKLEKVQVDQAIVNWAMITRPELLQLCAVLFENYESVFNELWKWITKDINSAMNKQICTKLALEVHRDSRTQIEDLEQLQKEINEYYLILFPAG